MPPPPLAALVERHYTRPGLAGRLLAALERAGKDPAALTRDDVAAFDEFHIRGRQATRELAVLASLAPGMEVLDVGCGVGGPARTLAAEFGCRVTGLDLVDEYVRAAATLTERVGLADRVRFLQGDAGAMPLPDARFDAAVLEHVTMNVDDTGRLFHEVARVLRPGGRLALYEVVAGAGGPAHYPVPWASGPEISFLLPCPTLLARVEAAGFAVVAWCDVSPPSLTWFRRHLAAAPDAPPVLGLHLLMGADARLKLETLVRNLEEDRVRVVQGAFVSAGGAAP
jgi:SAM-dependent methyltransferase